MLEQATVDAYRAAIAERDALDDQIAHLASQLRDARQQFDASVERVDKAELAVLCEALGQ